MSRSSVILPLLILFLFAHAAYGQGTSGVFVDPISDRDLSVYAARLEMSPQQRLAVDRFHETYLETAQALREGPVQEFLDASGNLMRTFMFAPDPKAMRKSLRELERINDRIGANDELLFDRMLTVLSEDQAARLPRVRQVRERKRLLGGVVRFVTFSHQVLQADLTAVAGDIDLSADDRAALEPLLPDYEARFTAAARRLERETGDMFASVIRRIEALGFGEGEDARSQRRALWRELRQVWLESSEGVLDAATALALVNRRSARDLAAALSHEGHRRLTDGFRERAYRSIHLASRRPIQRYTAALTLPDLEPDQAKAIESGLDALIVRHDQLAVKMIDLTEKMQRAAMLRRFGGGEAPEAAELDELKTLRDAVNEQALATLEAILGPDGMAMLARGDSTDKADATEDMIGPGEKSAGVAEVRGSERTVSTSRAVPRRADPFLPEAISEAELATYRARLALNDDQAEVLRSIYQGYLTKFDRLETERIGPLVETATNLWTIEEGSGRLLPPGPAAIAALFRNRRATFDAIRAADRAFLDDIEFAVIARDDDARQNAMIGVRRARDRITYNIGVDSRTGMPFGSRVIESEESRESSLDVAVLFDETRASPETRSKSAPVLEPYEQAVTDLFRQRYELAINYAEQHEAIRAESSHARDQARRLDVGATFRALSDGLGAELRAVSSRIITLNRETLDALYDALPPGERSALRASYQRVANPHIYADSGAAGPSFQRALGLEELGADQRARIGELFAEYRAEYDRLNDQLVELDRQTNEAERRRRNWRERQKRRNAREQLEFQRTELNEKSLRRLRAEISEDQATRLGIREG